MGAHVTYASRHSAKEVWWVLMLGVEQSADGNFFLKLTGGPSTVTVIVIRCVVEWTDCNNCGSRDTLFLGGVVCAHFCYLSVMSVAWSIRRTKQEGTLLQRSERWWCFSCPQQVPASTSTTRVYRTHVARSLPARPQHMPIPFFFHVYVFDIIIQRCTF